MFFGARWCGATSRITQQFVAVASVPRWSARTSASSAFSCPRSFSSRAAGSASCTAPVLSRLVPTQTHFLTQFTRALLLLGSFLFRRSSATSTVEAEANDKRSGHAGCVGQLSDATDIFQGRAWLLFQHMLFSLYTWCLLLLACLVFPTPGFLPPLPFLCFFMLNGLVSLRSDPAFLHIRTSGSQPDPMHQCTGATTNAREDRKELGISLLR